MPTRCNRWFLLRILLLAQHVSGTIMPIIRSSRVLYRRLLPVVFGALVFKLSVWCGAEGYVSGLRAAAISNKICNKNHLLLLVGTLFPHIKVSCFLQIIQKRMTVWTRYKVPPPKGLGRGPGNWEGSWSLSFISFTVNFYCCLCILFLDAATLTEVFPCFFLGCRANARV